MNYQNVLEKIISNELNNKTKSKLLLQACCAPCSSYVLEYLSEIFEITILFYNPNIYPESEFIKRYNELKRLVNDMNINVEVISIGYKNEEFETAINGLELEKEGGKRCFKCYRLRLEATAKYAKDNNFDYFGTTLSISPYKNANKLNEIGECLEKEYGIKYLYSDFKKKNGYKRSIELSKIYNLYRQNYCGCIYSKKDNGVNLKN